MHMKVQPVLHKTFIIKPTMNCNLRCRYCFEFHKNGNFYDNHSLSIDDTERLVSKTADLFPKSRILWLLHGGEPFLCGASFLRRFLSAVRFARDTKGVDFQIAVQTNGTLLTDECVALLQDNADLLSGRVVSISIDGPQPINDLVRVSTDGRSSFTKVMDGIKRIQNSSLKFSTISVIGSHNIDHPKEVYGFMKSIQARLCKFIPCYNFSATGQPERFGINPIQYAKFMCSVFDMWMHDLPELPRDQTLVIDPIATVLAKITNVFVTWCEYRAEKCDNFVCLYPDGELWLCDTMDHLSMRDYGFIGNIRSMSDDALTKALLAPCHACRFHEFYEEMMNDCNRCDIFGLCKGGCLPMRSIIKAQSSKLFVDYCSAKHLLFDHIRKAVQHALP